MEPEFWRQRWEEGRIGFHRQEVHPDLIRFEAELTGGRGVLVPLCGKSLDLVWLASRLPVLGVELAEQAVEQFFQEQGLVPQVDQVGAFRRYRADRLVILCGDIFDLRPQDLPFEVDRVWDRAALVALDPPRRRRYAQHLTSLLGRGRILLNAFSYDPQVMGGPPHSVPEAEVRELYAGASVTVLDDREELTERSRELGHSWWRTQVYRLELSP